MYDNAEAIREHYQRATERLLNYAAKTGQYATPLILNWLKYVDRGATDHDAVKYSSRLEKMVDKHD